MFSDMFTQKIPEKLKLISLSFSLNTGSRRLSQSGAFITTKKVQSIETRWHLGIAYRKHNMMCIVLPCRKHGFIWLLFTLTPASDVIAWSSWNSFFQSDIFCAMFVRPVDICILPVSSLFCDRNQHGSLFAGFYGHLFSSILTWAQSDIWLRGLARKVSEVAEIVLIHNLHIILHKKLVGLLLLSLIEPKM